MNQTQKSYNACLEIARLSGSNFYRAFEFLRPDRRQAMTALYAFSRLADDATDNTPNPNSWDLQKWIQWLDSLDASTQNPLNAETDFCPRLASIQQALVDSVERFNIPRDLLHQILLGVDQDTNPWEVFGYRDLQSYMDRVASAVGLCCMAIWSNAGSPQVGTRVYRMGIHCGHAFQLTNILRDLVEDAQRGRMYLATEDLCRFGFERNQLIESLAINDPSIKAQRIQKLGNWPELMRIYTQRAAGCYASGWGIYDAIDTDSKRMFSMIWNTYYQIFQKIQQNPWTPIHMRPSLNVFQKTKLYASHAFTPWFRRQASRSTIKTFDAKVQIQDTPHVAVIGGGLAGIRSAMHLAKHGCQVWLLESRNRLGGRVGSFSDSNSPQVVDYCQHVGMRCCHELVRWIQEIAQEDLWQEESTLWFRSNSGRRFSANAWPLPAPFHLSGLLLNWPDLKLIDRATIAWGLIQLIRTSPTKHFQKLSAKDWLKNHRQTPNAINCFWNTILVSALGEQLDRITMGSVHKVIIDGFAATKDAFHLLVPKKSLSELVDQSSREQLEKQGVRIVQGKTVLGLTQNQNASWSLQIKSTAEPSIDLPDFDALVIAVPWHRLGDLLERNSTSLPEAHKSLIHEVKNLESAPITGVHTWWSKPWFSDPHAILINRLCQWIFPGPQDRLDPQNSNPNEHYYQIVISGSRDLPKGNSDEILRMVEADLQEAFPELRNSGAQMLRGKVVTDPHSVFSVHSGHQNARVESGLMGDQGLFLAGDWTATGWPATMEGALRSGSISASDVLLYVGRPADVCIEER